MTATAKATKIKTRKKIKMKNEKKLSEKNEEEEKNQWKNFLNKNGHF